MKTLEANVVKSLFAVLSNLSLKVLQCLRRQTKRFFCNFLAVFCDFGVSNCRLQVEFGAYCVSNGLIMAKKRFDLTTLTCHKK